MGITGSSRPRGPSEPPLLRTLFFDGEPECDGVGGVRMAGALSAKDVSLMEMSVASAVQLVRRNLRREGRAKGPIRAPHKLKLNFIAH